MQKEQVKKCTRCCVVAFAALLVMDCFANAKVSPPTRELSEIKKSMSLALEADGDKSEKAPFDTDVFIQRVLKMSKNTSRDEMLSLSKTASENAKAVAEVVAVRLADKSAKGRRGGCRRPAGGQVGKGRRQGQVRVSSWIGEAGFVGAADAGHFQDLQSDIKAS